MNSIFLDKGHPTLLSCPKDIVVSTNKRSITVDWTIPGYSDNCGPNCLLRITSNYQPLFSRFLLGKTTEVQYKATDPSGNTNIDCVFTVNVKGRDFTKFIVIRSVSPFLVLPLLVIPVNPTKYCV